MDERDDDGGRRCTPVVCETAYAAWFVVRTVVSWTDGQSMGDIGAPGSHRWCN
jgi:hypothetical protein